MNTELKKKKCSKCKKEKEALQFSASIETMCIACKRAARK